MRETFVRRIRTALPSESGCMSKDKSAAIAALLSLRSSTAGMDMPAMASGGGLWGLQSCF